MPEVTLTLTPQDETNLRRLLDAVQYDRWAGAVLLQGALPQVPQFEQLPTPSAFYAFCLAGTRNLPDVVYCCLRDIGGVWDWREVATG